MSEYCSVCGNYHPLTTAGCLTYKLTHVQPPDAPTPSTRSPKEGEPRAMRYTEQQQSQARILIADLRSKGIISIPHTDDRRYLSEAVHAVANLIADTALAAQPHSQQEGEQLGTCDLVSRPHRKDHCGDAWRPLPHSQPAEVQNDDDEGITVNLPETTAISSGRIAEVLHSMDEAFGPVEPQGIQPAEAQDDCLVDARLTESHMERARIILGRSDNPLFLGQLLANHEARIKVEFQRGMQAMAEKAGQESKMLAELKRLLSNHELIIKAPSRQWHAEWAAVTDALADWEPK